MSFDSVPDIIVKHTDTWYLADVSFHQTKILRKRTVSTGPSFSIKEDVRFYFSQCALHFFHGDNVMDSHEIKPESVDLIFLHPENQGIDDEFSHHLSFRCRLIAAARGVSELTADASMVIKWNCFVEV